MKTDVSTGACSQLSTKPDPVTPVSGICEKINKLDHRQNHLDTLKKSHITCIENIYVANHDSEAKTWRH